MFSLSLSLKRFSLSAMSSQVNGVDEESLVDPLLGSNHHDHDADTFSLRRNTTSQLALVGANVCPIESLDCEIIENAFFKQDWRTRGKIQIFQYIFMKWVLCLLIGLIVSLIGFLINLAVENLAGMKFVVTSNMMLEKRYWTAFFVFAASNFGLTLFASLFTALISPAAAGSGIPEVKAY